MRDHITVGNTVIVTDGSYMMNSELKHTFGSDFINDGKHELLTVIATNIIGLPTDNKVGDPLAYSNNCIIQGFDGKIYFCSKINIERYKE